MKLKIMLPGIKFKDVPSGMLFTDERGNRLFAMTSIVLTSTELFNIKMPITINNNILGKNNIDHVMDLFSVKSLSGLAEQKVFLVSLEGELTEIKR